MTRGRKPDVLAVRRSGKPTEAKVVAVGEGYAEKPEFVLQSPALSACWDELVGDGTAYAKQDTALLTQWVFWSELANQCMARLLGRDGVTIDSLATALKGDSVMLVDSPYFRQFKQATDMVLKLADHFGGTPYARAKLGLTRAAEASLGEDIRRKVLKALDEHERRGN